MKPLQGCNPLSLVSVGLDEEDDNDMKDEGLSFDNGQEQNCTFCSKAFLNRKQLNRHIKSVHQKFCSVAYQYCGRVLSDADSYKDISIMFIRLKFLTWKKF